MKATDFFEKMENMNYSNFVKSQVEDMKVDDLKIVDIGDRPVSRFRMNLSRIASDIGYKFKTKVVDGKLYVGRIE